MDELVVPKTPARRGVERNQAIRVEVVAEPVSAIEVAGRRSRRGKDDAPGLVEGHAGPTVRAAAVGPGLFGPRLVASLARMRNRVEAPAQHTGPHVVRADVTR